MDVEIPYTLSENFHNAKGEGIKKFVKGFKTVSLAPTRGAFLAIMRINPMGLTTRLAAGFVPDPDFTPETVAKAKPNWEKFKKIWIKFGGSVAKLEKNIKKGYKRKASQKVNDAFKKILKKKANFDGNYNVTGGDDAALIIGAATAAMPVLILAIKAVAGIKKPLFKKGTAGESIDAAIDTEVPTPEVVPEITTDTQGNLVDEKGQPIDADKIFGLPKNGVYGVVVLLGLGITGFILWKVLPAKKAVAPAIK